MEVYKVWLACFGQCADGVNNTFVAVGITAAGQYSGSDANFTNLATINNKTISEVDSGDAFIGSTGYDTLHVYGTADLAGVTLTSIDRVILHSDVTFTTEQMAAFNTAGAEIIGDGSSIMRMDQSGPVTSVDMSNISLQAIGQFDLAASLTAQIDQLGLNQIGAVAAGTDSFIQAAAGTLDFTGKTVYGPGSIKDANGTVVGALDAVPGLGAHLNLVVTSVAELIDNMNAVLAGVPGYSVQDKVNLDVASMSLYLGSQTEADVIAAGGNSAFLRGGGFDDTIIGGSGTNFISGNTGNDTISGMRVSLPYWNWTENRKIPDHLRMELFGWMHITRAVFHDGDKLPTATDLRNAKNATTYLDFDSRMNDLHGKVHNWVGGTMATFKSPKDPLFFLNHAFVDKVWAEWQAAHPTLQFSTSILDASLAPWDNVKVRDVMSISDMGYSYG